MMKIWGKQVKEENISQHTKRGEGNTKEKKKHTERGLTRRKKARERK